MERAVAPAGGKDISSKALKFRSYDPAIEGYLIEVRKHLHGLVPPAQAELFLQDTADWVELEAAALTADGLSDADAAQQAISTREDPRSVATGIIEAYFDNADNSLLVKRMGRANAFVFILFGGANALYLLLMELAIAFPSMNALHSPASPSAIHRFYPQFLPFPELTWQFLFTVDFPIIAPPILGWWIGRLVPVYSARAVLFGLIPIIACATVVGIRFLPDTSGVFYVLLLTFYWLPVGCLMAHLSSSFQRPACRRTRQ